MKTDTVELTIIRKNVGALHLAQSEPRQVEGAEVPVGARGTITAFSVESIQSGPMAGTPKPDSEQAEKITVKVIDGVVANPAGLNLARLVANGDIFVQGPANLPKLPGNFKTRKQLLELGA